jgi:hypothetical protein
LFQRKKHLSCRDGNTMQIALFTAVGVKDAPVLSESVAMTVTTVSTISDEKRQTADATPDSKKRKKAGAGSEARKRKVTDGGASEVTTVSQSYNEEVKVAKDDKVALVTGGNLEAKARQVTRTICHVHKKILGGENFSFGVPIEQCWLMHEEEGQRKVDTKKVVKQQAGQQASNACFDVGWGIEK